MRRILGLPATKMDGRSGAEPPSSSANPGADAPLQNTDPASQTHESATVSVSDQASSEPASKQQRRSRAATVITPNACTECRKKRAKVGTFPPARFHAHARWVSFSHTYFFKFGLC